MLRGQELQIYLEKPSHQLFSRIAYSSIDDNGTTRMTIVMQPLFNYDEKCND